MRILIVDDKKHNLSLMESVLKKSKYEVVTASNGVEALKKLFSQYCEMVISDIFMPVMDGFTLCRKIRNDKKLNNIYIVFYTATYTDEKDEDFASKLGADLYLKKPMEPAEFLKIINRTVEQIEKGILKPKKPSFGDKADDFQHYSDRLAEKLEKKVTDLENEVAKRKRTEEELQKLNVELEQRVLERGAVLEALNEELKAFSYSVSHDLRFPLRTIKGFVNMIIEEYSNQLKGEGQRQLKIIYDSVQMMEKMINGLLSLSSMGRQKMELFEIDMERLANDVFKELRFINPGRKLDFKVGKLPKAYGDPIMIRLVLMNLMSNAIKFTEHRDTAIIEAGSKVLNNEIIYYIKDNGIGFDNKYVDKLFGVFQRLHSHPEYDGAGVGLAIVKRIINRHKGRVWAEGDAGKGSTFYFTWPQ